MAEFEERTFFGNKIVVVLYTGPCLDLAQAITAPAWVKIFSQMKADGYLFSIAECACGELINQRSRKSISDAGFGRMLEMLDDFLEPIFPVMVGEMDVLKMIGAKSRPIDYCYNAAALSKQSWEYLLNDEAKGSHVADDFLEEERSHWKASLEKINQIYLECGSPDELNELHDPILDEALKTQSSSLEVVPPMSTRFDLRTRYIWRQFVRSRRKREPYNSNAPKKRNDGIDFRIYTFLSLPALVVATEKGYFGSIENIPSFQKSWFVKPDDLVYAWDQAGQRPMPKWP